MTTFEERLESGLAEAWRPDKEDADLLVGEVIDIQRGTSDYEPYPLIVVRLDDGTEKAVHAFHTVLKNELMRQRPKIGERIGIKYLGEQPTKPGSKFKSFIGYRVRIDRVGGEFDWTSIGTTDEDPIPAAPAPETPADAGEDDIPF